VIDIVKTVIVKASNSRAIARAITALRRGGVIIYPTETAYGLGAYFSDTKAVTRIYRIKHRPKGWLLSVIVGSYNTVKRYVALDAQTLKLARKFMPGPLTIVSRLKGRKSLAWRIPSHWFALELSKRFGKPITATSANISGQSPLYRFGDVRRTFDGKVDVIVNAGNLPKRTPSTIYDVHTMKVLRKGPISKSAILAAL